METKKYTTLFTICLVMFFISSAYGSEYSNRIYNAYLTESIEDWISVINDMEENEKNDPDHLLELAGYYYGICGYLINSGQNREAKEYISRGEQTVEKVLKINSENPLALSYKGTFIAFRMSLAKMKAVFLGPQSLRYINKAYTLDPEHHQIIADKANLLYYAPSLFGGDKEKAFSLYRQSIEKMEIDKQNSSNWFYLSLQTSLIGMYCENNNIEEAKTIYLHLLETEPRYNRIREEFSFVLD